MGSSSGDTSLFVESPFEEKLLAPCCLLPKNKEEMGEIKKLTALLVALYRPYVVKDLMGCEGGGISDEDRIIVVLLLTG